MNIKKRATSCFCQFVHDGSTLFNKDKYQAFGMKFTDTQFRHNDAIILSFRKPLTRKTDKVAQLEEEVCNDILN